jgi:hypothetical protein
MGINLYPRCSKDCVRRRELGEIFAGRTMSPLVLRSGVKNPPSDGAQQHWSMLVFESLSAGAMALFVAIAAVMVLVGAYLIFVWPLTSWDLSNLGLEKYAPWSGRALWSVFAGGTLVGFWAFSGAAFKRKKQRNERNKS